MRYPNATQVIGFPGANSMRLFVILLVAAFFSASTAKAASEFGTKEEAVAMVHRVQELFKREGAEATFKAVSDPSTKEFHDRDLYPFIYDFSLTCFAHGARPALIGKNLADFKDMDGKYPGREMVRILKGAQNGWVDYKFVNPVNNKIEDKSAYVEKLNDEFFVGVGVYRE
jgi:signal transduction histidine kinase